MIYKNKLDELLIQGTIVSRDGLQVTFSKKGTATTQQIKALNERFDIRLPVEYVNFLLDYNGLELYKYEDIGGFLFFQTDNLVEENNLIKEDYEAEDWDNSIVLFCRVLGEGNFIGFRLKDNDKYEVIDCFHESLPSEWEVIETSFNIFMDKLLKNEGEKYWLV